MLIGDKIKELRKRFNLSQEEMAKLINVSRQAICKWENNNGIPDISNLKEIARLFDISVDYLIDENNDIKNVKMIKSINKTKNKLNVYNEILKEYNELGYEIYILTRSKKLSLIEIVIDTFTAPEIGPCDTADMLSDLSPYYLLIKDEYKFLLNIRKSEYTIEELPHDIKNKKFVYNNNVFRNCGKYKIK